jgi:hypothetical protein
LNYTIAMTDEADDDLADVWMSASDPWAINSAMNDAERILSMNPLSSSESLSEGLRRLKLAPILLYFRVDLPRRIVEISNIRLILFDPP